MFNTKTIYITLVRERTNEKLLLELNSALSIIKKYDEKQQFMTMLGQDTFWKKNRLDLWAALTDLSIDQDTLKPEDKHTRLLLNDAAFQNTPIMLASIKHRLKDTVEQLIDDGRKIETTLWHYSDHNFIYENGERNFVDRAVRVNVPNHYIRYEDIEAFDRDFNKLMNKYLVKEPTRLRNGKKRFNYRTVATRYVERVYGFKREQDYNTW